MFTWPYSNHTSSNQKPFNVSPVPAAGQACEYLLNCLTIEYNGLNFVISISDSKA